jgi:hypothetical protein
MSTIVTRASKGSALTWQEGDDNIINLNNDKLEDITQESIGDLSDVDTSGVAGNDLLMWDMSTSKFVASSQLSRDGGTAPGGTAPGGENSGTVTAINDQRTPNTITLDPGTGIVGGDRISFTGSDVTSAGLSTEIEYYIWAEVQPGEFEISEDNLQAYNGLIDFGTITNLNYTVTSMSSGGGGGGLFGLLLNDLGDVSLAAATDGQVLTYDSGSSRWIAQMPASGGGINSVSEDPSPQLGGNLVVGPYSIVNGDDQPILIQTPNLGFGGTSDTSIKLETAADQHIRINELSGNSSISLKSNGDITLVPGAVSKTQATRLNYSEAVHDLGTTSGTVAPDAALGNVQTITLNGNLTLNAFTSPVAGQSVTLIVNTGATGRTLTSTMKFAGGEKTLSDTNTTDIISIFYDGTNYWASLAKDFQ